MKIVTCYHGEWSTEGGPLRVVYWPESRLLSALSQTPIEHITAVNTATLTTKAETKTLGYVQSTELPVLLHHLIETGAAY